MSLFSFIKNPEQKFWAWFEENEDLLFNFENNRESTFDKLSSQLEKINKGLTFEFGPKLDDGKREFVISADGIKRVFPSVERLYESKPQLNRWIVIKFRPRRELNSLSIGNKTVNPNDVNYILFRDQDPSKVGIMIFFKEFDKNERDTWGQIGYLFLDEALGEYDVETKVGAIVFESPESQYFQISHPLRELAEDFDGQFLMR